MTGVHTFAQIQDSLLRALNATALRHEVISNNIANVNTPGYKRKDVVFEEELGRALEARSVKGAGLRTTHPGHLDGSGSGSGYETQGVRVVSDSGVTMREDGNSVDIDREMAELAKNSLRYSYLADAVSRQMRLVKLAIQEGRR